MFARPAVLKWFLYLLGLKVRQRVYLTYLLSFFATEALTVICINLTAASADAGDQWRNEKGSKESFFGPVQVVLYLVLTYKFSSTITHSPQMSSVVNISIVNHTTSSTPSPHVLYVVNVTFDDGQQNKVLRRYSQVFNIVIKQELF